MRRRNVESEDSLHVVDAQQDRRERFDLAAERLRCVGGRAKLYQQLRGARGTDVGQRKGQRLLVARRSLAAHRQVHRGAADARSGKVCGFENDGGRCVADLAVRAAHHAGDAQRLTRLVRIRDDERARRQRTLDVVERHDLLVLAGVAHDQARVLHAIRVVKVQRLPGLEHHVVRDVDEIVDRALAGQRQANAHPRRSRSDADAVEALRDEAQAVGRRDRNLGRFAGGRIAGAGIRVRRKAQRCSVRRGKFAREPEHRHGVDAIARDLDVEHRVAQAEELDDVRAERRVSSSSCMMPSSNHSAGSAELVGRDHHAFGCDAAHLARFDGQLRRASRRSSQPAIVWPTATFVAAVAIVSGFVAGNVDLRDLKAIGVRVLLECDDPSDDDAGDDGPPLDLLDRKAEHRETIGDRRRIVGNVDVLTQPRERNAHEISLLKLLEKLGFAVDESANVVDFVARETDPFGPEAERPTGIHVGIVADFAQHVRMDHSGAAQLDPSRTAAHAARVRAPFTLRTGRVDFGARFGERKERRAKAHAVARARTVRGTFRSACP